MALGDGNLRIANGCKNASFRFDHCEKQHGYLLYKKTLVEYLTSCNFRKNDRMIKGEPYVSYSVETKTHPFYTKLYEHLYFDGRRTVDEHVLKCLTPLVLALWYLDDGCLTNDSDFLTPLIATHAYSKIEVELMSRVLQKQFGLQWRCNKKGTKYQLRLRNSDREPFFNLIRPFVHSPMEYKIRDDGKRAIKKHGEPVKLSCTHCGDEFVVGYQHRHRKYCGSKCYHEASKGKPKGKSTTRICEACGDEYTPNTCSSSQRFCSLDCYWGQSGRERGESHA